MCSAVTSLVSASPPSRFALRWTTSAWLANRSSRIGKRERRMERETGFEPATSTLARSHSTTELLQLSSRHYKRAIPARQTSEGNLQAIGSFVSKGFTSLFDRTASAARFGNADLPGGRS